MRPFVVSAAAFYLYIITPAFADLVPTDGQFRGTLGEFTLMDNVKSKAPIINIKKAKNILQRRDASCDLNYKKLLSTTNRMIAVEELYAATQMCRNSFYQDSLKDWRDGNESIFGESILPFFQEAFYTDLASNAYFGDMQRPQDPNAEWSTTMYDGIFKWARYYAATGVIKPGQTFAMPVTDMRANPQTAYAVIKSAADRRPTLMRNLPASEQAFYVDAAIKDGYNEYLRALGDESSFIVQRYANGVEISSYLGIPIYVDPLWEAILEELYGANNHALILTIKGNMVFATDKEYGEGPSGKDALVVWYDFEHMSWKFQQFVKAGTQIALPEFFVFALPA